ncbi:hypothetical protein [Streptomyces sp. NPDC002671]
MGQAALIATDAAITVLVHAIDVDIASEQIAAEAKLKALLKREPSGGMSSAPTPDRTPKPHCLTRCEIWSYSRAHE